MSEVLVVGGGVAGMQASLDLAAMGYQVILVEKEKALGGNLRRIDRVFPTNEKAVDILEDYTKRIAGEKRIKIVTESVLERVQGKAPAFKVAIDGNGGKKDLTVSAIVLATGFKPYDVAQKREYGYGRIRDVVSAIELEEMLKQEKLDRPSDSKKPESIVFVQCVGFRDARANEYCSSFCCKDTVKNAILLKKEQPDTRVTVMYMDIRTPSLCEQMYSEAKDLGVRFIRSRPAEVYEKNGKLRINFENTLTGKVGSVEAEMMVLSVGAVPTDEADELGRMMGLQVGESGFFKAVSEPSETGVHGVFLAGACCGPKDIDYAACEASAAAAQVNKLLRSAKVEG